VTVGGTSYDVSFQDGTCESVFLGCDDLADFPFQSGASALAASQALLDQVFLDGASLDTAFDMIPRLTRGCTGQSCVAVTVYGLGGLVMFTASAENHGAFDGLADVALLDSRRVGIDFSGDANQVFAAWTLSPVVVVAVPEGSALGLLGAGLCAWVLARRRRARTQ
jgi:hypothetical protein